MGVTIDVVRVAANTATGNQDITGSLGGLTPKAALFILSGAVTDGTARDDSTLSYGAATGVSNEWAVGGFFKHGLTTTDGTTWNINDGCIAIYDEADSPNPVARANFVSFLTNGVRINWSDAPDVAHLITVVLFAGTDLSAHANWISVLNTTDLKSDTTDPGFEPDVLFTALDCGHTTPRTDGTIIVHQYFSLGLVHNDGVGGVTQYSSATNWPGNQGTTVHIGDVRDDYGIVEVAASLDWGGEFGSFVSNGFSITTRVTGGNNREVYYLALKFGSLSSWVGPYTTPTTTGADSITAPGFKPQYLHVLAANFAGFNSPGVSVEAASRAVFAIDSDAQFASSVSSEHSVGTSNVQSLSDNVAVELPEDDGSAKFTGSFTSFDTSGWTWNFSATDTGTARKWFALAIEAEGAVDDSDSREAYTAGGVNESDSQAAYIPAGFDINDMAPGYIQGLTYFPFTEYFTGQANEAAWLKSKWVNEEG